MGSLIAAVQIVTYALTLLVFADIVVSFFLSPFNPIRQALDSVVDPLLAPIRRLVPPMGMLDWSPAVLIILIQVAGSLLVRILETLR